MVVWLRRRGMKTLRTRVYTGAYSQPFISGGSLKATTD